MAASPLKEAAMILTCLLAVAGVAAVFLQSLQAGLEVGEAVVRDAGVP